MSEYNLNSNLENISLEDITKIILKGECATTEFKESYSVHFAKYCNTVASFANTKGGYIIFGVRDDGQIVGVPSSEKQRKNIIDFIIGNVKPSVDIDTHLIKTTTGEYIYIIKIEADNSILHTSGNIAYKRIDSQNKPMVPSEIEKYINSISKIKTQPTQKIKKTSGGVKKKGSLNEISTVIFKIRPYLDRLGYEPEEDLDFGEPAISNGKLVGFTDIRIKSNNKLAFVIEVKRDNSKITQSHINQAINYGSVLKVPFVAVTNGLEFQVYNTKTQALLKLNGDFFNALPYKKDLANILDYFKKHPNANDIKITDRPQTYKKGINKNELIKIFKKCHNAIRDIEKDDEHAFSDFSKILFLKLLEEKSEVEAKETDGFKLPRGWYYFDELKKNKKADQVMQDIKQMFASIKEDKKYGEIFKEDRFYADNESTYKYIVDELANISFQDSEVDAKGSAFEYFCKFNLKGSKLGQYFTPREIVNLMVDLVDLKPLIFSLNDTANFPKVIDPSCGSGGFLVQGMHRLIEEIKKQNMQKDRETKMIKTIKEKVFWGSDANPTIARTAKMNMVIAGDGSSNIYKGNSLDEEVDFLKIKNRQPQADYVLANPPFGMSESNLPEAVLRLYDVHTTKGQALFIQKMIKITKPNGRICTIVDEGILNNPKMEDMRKYILKTCFIDAVVSLPMVTFKPNYTNVKTSFLLLTKKPSELEKQTHPIFMCDLKQVGYDSVYQPLKPTSAEINGEVTAEYVKFKNDEVNYKTGYSSPDRKKYIDDNVKTCFSLTINEIQQNYKSRLDVRFNHPIAIKLIKKLQDKGAIKMKDLLTGDIVRGSSPQEAEEGKPILKVRNITKRGIEWETDFTTEEFYLRSKQNGRTPKKGDLLIASTGVGSLGKVCLMDIATECCVDGHISILKINKLKIQPDFLTAYLRSNYGQSQFNMLYSGSTGQIEIYPDDLEHILVVVPKTTQQTKIVELLEENRNQIEKFKKQIDVIQSSSIDGFEKIINVI